MCMCNVCTYKTKNLNFGISSFVQKKKKMFDAFYVEFKLGGHTSYGSKKYYQIACISGFRQNKHNIADKTKHQNSSKALYFCLLNCVFLTQLNVSN